MRARAVGRGRHAVQLAVGEIRQGGLEIGVPVGDEQDPAELVRRHDRPGPVVEGEVVRRRAREAGLHHRHGLRHVVDDHLGAGLRIEEDVAGLEEDAVAVELEPPLGRLDVQVGEADEHRMRHA